MYHLYSWYEGAKHTKTAFPLLLAIKKMADPLLEPLVDTGETAGCGSLLFNPGGWWLNMCLSNCLCHAFFRASND